jgi:hypothetical protein
VFVPVLVHSVKDTEQNAFAAVAGGEGAYGADAAAHFHKEPFDHTGGEQASGGPESTREVKFPNAV